MYPKLIRKTLIASSVALAFGASGAQAALVPNVFGAYNWSTQSGNFTMLSPVGGTNGVFPIPGGATVGGTNDVTMVWDGNGYTSSSDYTGPGSAANVTASSPTAFFGTHWTAHDIQVFVPGSYSFDTALGGGNPESGIMNVTVGASQLGMHMLFDWSGNLNIDMVVVFAQNSIFGPGIGRSTNIGSCDQTPSLPYPTGPLSNCLWDGAKLGPDGKPAGNKVWMLSSTDGNGDGIMGIPMAAGGPFQFFNANFNANLTPTPDTVVPVPAAVWLFGSGLLGLVGVARRRKKTA
jgi:hypothetical protein